MFERYHIALADVPGRCHPVPKFEILRADNCANCGKCERACVYGVHKRSEQDPRKMADPVNSLCKNCFRCIAECPQRALTMMLSEEYRSLGRGIWTSQRIVTIWSEAESGRIPVFGAGYRGPFAGSGYDGMWTDMSEIVRPTRDGIHGREYISTSVDIGRKPDALEFGDGGALRTKMPPIIEQPVPVVLDLARLRAVTDGMMEGFARAAKRLQCLMMAPANSLPTQSGLNGSLVPVYPEGSDVSAITVPDGVRMVEVGLERIPKGDLRRFRKNNPSVVLGFRLRAGPDIDRRVLDLVRAGADAVHILFDEEGNEESGDPPRHSRDSLRAVHKALVSKAVRDEITVIAGGGIAAAEHVPKTIICGADVVAIERALLIALECRNCITCSLASCPANLSSASPEWIEGRVCNMVGAWRDQLLEVLGAMGLREARRLRGELGRAIFFEDMERESFAGIEGGGSNA
ncbi:MAG: glutamate synthase-related protein [Thermoplasmata archaeon]